MERVNALNLNLSQLTAKQLIQYILDVHHQFMDQELPELYAQVLSLQKMYGDLNPKLSKVAQLFQEFKEIMERHSQKEEEEVFPLLLEYEQSPSSYQSEQIEQRIKELKTEHQESQILLQQLSELTNQFQPPIELCSTYTAIYQRLADFCEEVRLHIHWEDQVLFAKFQTA